MNLPPGVQKLLEPIVAARAPMMTTTPAEPPPVQSAPLPPAPMRPVSGAATANICGLLGLPLLARIVSALREQPFDGEECTVSIALAVFAYAVGVVAVRAMWQRAHEGHAVRRRCEAVGHFCTRAYVATGSWCQRWSVTAIWLAALAGVVLSCYPIIFLGKSFVGPAISGTLLYDHLPTLPGSTEKYLTWRNGSDVGAGMLASLPYSAVEGRSIFHDGEFPLWNRYNSGGIPMLGQGQSMIGDPLNTLVILLGGNGWAWDLKFLLARLLFAAGIGLTVRQALEGKVFAAVVLAFGACFLGFFPYRFNHPACISVCYAPWILYAWLRLKSEVGSRKSEPARQKAEGQKFSRSSSGSDLRLPTSHFLLLLSNWSELCSGTAKESCFLMILLNAAGALALLLDGSLPWRNRLRRLALAAWVGGCFLLFSAPLWLTFLAALPTAWTAYTDPGALQIQPGALAGLFDDIFFRQYNHMAMVHSPATNFLVLLGIGLALAGWRTLARQRTFVAFGVVTLATGALVFGVVPPQAIAAVPFLGNVIHVDTTLSCPLIVLLTVLAGFGLQHARDRLQARDWTLDVWGAVAVLGVVVALFLGSAQAVQDTDFAPMPLDKVAHRAAFFWIYLGTLVAAFAALPFLWRRLCRDRGASLPGVLPWVALCVTAICWRQGLHVGAVAGPDLYVIYPPARADYHAPSKAVERLLALQRDHPGRTAGFNGNLAPGFGAALGLEMTSGPDALQNRYLHALALSSEVPMLYGWSMCVTRGDVSSQRRRFYDMLNLRYYLGLPVPPGKPPEPVPPYLRLLAHDDLDVFESDTVWPRAFFTDAAAVCPDDKSLLALLDTGDGLPFVSVAADGLAARPELRALVNRGLEGRALVPATDYHLTANSTQFRVHAAGPGVVALMEAYQPQDMRVTVNGQPAACVRVNQAFSGVYLDRAGDYTVRFRYWPRLWTPSLWLATLGAALLGATAWKMTASGRR